MPRVVSFIVLLAIILLIGMKFFQVMVLFIVPLFLAAVLVVIFKPLHEWMEKKVAPRKRLAALLTTGAIVLIVLLPTAGLALRAANEGTELIALIGSKFAEANPVAPAPDGSAERPEAEPQRLPDEGPEEVPSEEPGEDLEKEDATDALHFFVSRIVKETNGMLEYFRIPFNLDETEVQGEIIGWSKQMAASVAVGGLRFLGGALVSLGIMILTTYYFFADGPAMIEALMRMSPLDDTYERELLNKFSDISRSVVVATLLSAIVQGALAGVGYYFAGIERVVFLTVLTMFLAMVPFVGAAAVWVPVCAWLHFVDGRTTASIVLMVYCVGVVSMVDNLIKPYILHGQANLHPLLALLSVIGGVQVLGPLGILVGPMLVAFLQALMNMLNKELQEMGKEAKSLEKALAKEVTTQAKK